MTQAERRHYLINTMLQEAGQTRRTFLPEEKDERRLLRALFNVREPKAASAEFLTVEHDYLQTELERKGRVSLADLHPIAPQIYLWQGDITRLAVDAIVNAANSALLGCFLPNHACIDNAIHTAAGVELRLACAKLMEAQGTPEPTGKVKVTEGYNLPAKYVMHTVGPVVNGVLTPRHQQLLRASYDACLQAALKRNLHSLAFCCISTGVFGFPKREAAQIAVQAVRECQRGAGRELTVLFDVFQDDDFAIYHDLLIKEA